MTRRALSALPPALLLLALTAATAAASAPDNGEGIVGETDDKIVTFFSLGVVAFFPLLILILSAIQGRLEKRKDERKAAAMRSQAGW